MASSICMPAPVCLIENDDSGTLSVRKEGKDILERVNGPVVVVSVVGLYRTGKSYIMNRLAGQQSGFALGNTVESKTKGIWMWCVPHPSMPGHTLVLLDTEGLGDVKKGDSKNDGWIFCLAVLLSSTLVYNSRGTIDNNAVEQLHYIVELAEQIKIKSPSSASEEDEEGEENCVGRKISDFNMPRECIRSYFPSRKCFMFPPPASPENMRCLESLQEQDLVAGFLEATRRFCEYIFVKSAVKTLKGGHRVTGKLLGQLAQIYVDTISSGQVPCLENAVLALANQENQAAVQEALQVYKSGMEEITSKFPVSMDNITRVHQKCSSRATSEFMKRSFNDIKGEYNTKLKDEIDIYYAALLNQNETASEEKCKELLKNLFSDMSERLQNGAYSQPGGYEVYCRDRDDIIAQYRREPSKGVGAEAVLNEFLTQRGSEANTILHADKKLTENDKKIQEEKENAALLKQKCKEEEERRIESERMRQAEQERQEDRIKQMEEKFNKEIKQQQEEMDRALESKLREQEELIKKGFKGKAELLEEEIKSLKKEKEKISPSGNVFKEYVMPLVSTGVDLIKNILLQKTIQNGLTAFFKR